MKVGALVHMYPPMHNAGAEHMLHAILSEMVRGGIDCAVTVELTSGGRYSGDPYVLDGVQVGTRDVLAGCDVLLTHLDRTPEAETFALANGIPLAQIMHNHQRPGLAKHCQLAVYNSHWIAAEYPTRGCSHSVVMHPPVWPATYRVQPGDSVTLVNLSRAKGAPLFYELAAAMPDTHFLGVRGAYGSQVEPRRLANLEVLPTQTDMRVVYQRTRVLVMPSTYESYGRCAIEAAVSGIPTVANGTPGLREALGGAGTFPEHLDLNRWRQAIRGVLENWDAKSEAASALSASLDPADDVSRLIVALEALSEHAERAEPREKVRRQGTKLPISVVVMAHPSRREWAEALAKDLNCSAVYDRGQGLWDTARRSLAAFDPAASHHLVIQDDAILSANLLSEIGLAAAVVGAHPICLYTGNKPHYATDVTRAFDAASIRGDSWVQAPGPKWAVAVAHPVALLPQLLDAADALTNIKADDARLTAAYQALGVDCWYTVPSLADHRDGPSIVRKGSALTGRRARRFVENAEGWSSGAVHAPGTNAPVQIPTDKPVTYRNRVTGQELRLRPGSPRIRRLGGLPSWELIETGDLRVDPSRADAPLTA